MGQKSSLLEVILEIRPPATRVEHYFEQIFQTLFWADVWNITFSHHSHFNWCWKWIVRILAKYELSGVRLWCSGKCPTADCSHCPTLGWAMFLKQQQHVAQCFEHPLYIGHICTGHVPICPMSSVQCPMYIANIVLHCKQCPTLQTLSYIADIVLHWSLSVLKNRTTTCDPLPHQQPIPVEGGLIHFLQSRFRIFLKLSGFLPPLNMCEKCSKFHKNALQGLFNT